MFAHICTKKQLNTREKLKNMRYKFYIFQLFNKNKSMCYKKKLKLKVIMYAQGVYYYEMWYKYMTSISSKRFLLYNNNLFYIFNGKKKE